MPQSAVNPPSARSIVDFLRVGPLSGKHRQVSHTGSGTLSDRERRRRIAAGRPEWEEFQMRGEPVSTFDVHGAIDLLGESVDPNAVMNMALAYETITYDDDLGQVTTTASDYFSNQSDAWLEEEGFYDAGGSRGYTYKNLGTSPGVLSSTVSKAPADITVVPTSSTYPPRPRTVAAGYDPWRRTLTVVFRDGTFYNYYGVGGLEWSNFKRSRSKGRFIKTYLDGKVRGTAEMGGIPRDHQEVLYRIARTAQVIRGGYQAGQKIGSKRGQKGSYGSRNTAARAARKMRAGAERAFGAIQ